MNTILRYNRAFIAYGTFWSVYFTGSDFGANIQGGNPDAGIVRPEVAREMARRPTSNAPSNLTQDSLKVVVKRVYLLLDKPDGYTQLVIDTIGRIGIRCCHALYLALADTRDNWDRAAAFTRRFEGLSHGLISVTNDYHTSDVHRCTCSRWEYDHEYFQQMIEWE